MTFISFAQNFEDVMLWRALRHVSQGFFIDVGANDPDRDSVTRAFYDRGWNGINIEPVDTFHARLKQRRPRDVNLPVGLGSSVGRNVFYVVGESGLGTTDEAVAERHAADGWQVQKTDIVIDTLSNVCEAHAPAEIHFLKIDVEGMEKDVLMGADFNRWRPWILVIEATEANSQTPSHEAWEPLLAQAKYDFVYFDGLNRFYIAHEHPDLRAAFASPPILSTRSFHTLSNTRAWR